TTSMPDVARSVSGSNVMVILIVSSRLTRRPPASPLFPYTTLFRSLPLQLTVSGISDERFHEPGCLPLFQSLQRFHWRFLKSGGESDGVSPPLNSSGDTRSFTTKRVRHDSSDS